MLVMKATLQRTVTLWKKPAHIVGFEVCLSKLIQPKGIMPHTITEDTMQKEMIDPRLEKAGWYLCDCSGMKIKITVDDYGAEPRNGVSGYCLYCQNGEVLAVVAAGCTTHHARLLEAQLTHYITEIEKRQSFGAFGFPANRLCLDGHMEQLTSCKSLFATHLPRT